MIQYWNPAIFAAATAVVFAGVLVFVAMRNFRKLDNRLKLVLKTLYFNTKDLRNVSEKADSIISEQQRSFGHQQKSFDHHRVLVSSLNRQIRSLEAALFDGGYIDPRGTGLPSITPPPALLEVAQENLREVGVVDRRQLQAGLSAQKQGAVLLKTLLEEKRARARVAFGNEQKAAKLSTIFPDQNHAGNPDVNGDKRRISNG